MAASLLLLIVLRIAAVNDFNYLNPCVFEYIIPNNRECANPGPTPELTLFILQMLMPTKVQLKFVKVQHYSDMDEKSSPIIGAVDRGEAEATPAYMVLTYPRANKLSYVTPFLPTDCVWAVWDQWSACSVTCATGSRTRSRTEAQVALFNGVDCVGDSSETETCIGSNSTHEVPDCPIDCVWAAWAVWSSCSTTCGSGIQVRNRTQSQAALYGGAACTGNFGETQSCSGLPSCPVDCVWGVWQQWPACSVTCGAGSHTRSRTFSQVALFNGMDCAGSSSESATCVGSNSTHELPNCPIDCVWNTWGLWSACSVTCGNGTSSKARNQSQVVMYDGVDCMGNFTEEELCAGGNSTHPIHNCPLDCVWGPWIPEECSDDTGECLRKSARKKDVVEMHDGICDGEATKIEACDECGNPMSPAEQIVAKTMQSIGCTWLLILTGAVFVVSLLLRIRHLERLLHACEEFVLLCGHLFILFLRDATWNTALCTVTALAMQYTMMSMFVFFVLEALQMYAFVTNVRLSHNFLSCKANLAIGFGVPILIMIIPAAAFHSHYPGRYGCWLNLDSAVSGTTFVPILVSVILTFIIVEAAGQGEYEVLPGTDKTKRLLNLINQRGLLFVMPMAAAHWFFGMYAIHRQHVALYPVVFGLNIALGVLILLFHGFIHVTVKDFFVERFNRLKSCCSKKSTETGHAPEDVPGPAPESSKLTSPTEGTDMENIEPPWRYD